MKLLSFPFWVSYAILLTPTIALLPFAAIRLYPHIRLRFNGTRTKAVQSRSHYNNGVFSMTYTYRDHKNTRHHRKLRTNSFELTDFDEGESIPVVYDPARPGLSRTQGELRRVLPWSTLSTGTWLVLQTACAALAGARGFG
ncbi:hypothetical protein [Streptomyces sp. NPDC048442]|uniref:hypothetical protein n=1 Tax=Streptomyces sp. NPDC048442 TaxID=3154823 RepID=UPI0034155692